MTKRLLPSLLNANWASLGDACRRVIDGGAHGIHLDIMDNHYVPNLTFGPTLCADLKRFGIETFYDIHLMVEPVDKLIEAFAEAGADRITFHPEASHHVERSLALIKQYGLEAGIALNPATHPNVLNYLWHQLDHVLVMSVNPGFGGQSFIKSSLEKVRHLKGEIVRQQSKATIGIDGGINRTTLAQAKLAGAEEFVVGSAIFNAHAVIEDEVSALVREIEG